MWEETSMDFMSVVLTSVDMVCGIMASDHFDKEFCRVTNNRYTGLKISGDIDRERAGFKVTITFDTHLIG